MNSGWRYIFGGISSVLTAAMDDAVKKMSKVLYIYVLYYISDIPAV